MNKTIIHIINLFFVFAYFNVYAQDDAINGYRIEGDQIVFSFDKRDYNKVTPDSDYGMLDFQDLEIEDVIVSGQFNDWTRDSWNMTKIDDNRYELRKDLADFTDEITWEFKFLINNNYWAEPFENMGNITPAKTPDGHDLYVYNLKIYTAYPKVNGNACFKLKGYEDAQKVVLSGSFNKWNEHLFNMDKVVGGWELTLQVNPNEYEYKFIVDGIWVEDVENLNKRENEYGGFNSIIDVKESVTFKLNGYTEAEQVILSGTFNDWSEHAYKMLKTENGWEYTTKLSGGKHHYKFIVDGNWILDPENSVKEYDYNGNINSVCMVK